MTSRAELIQAAQSGEGEELWQAVRSRNSEALLEASHNRNLTDEMARFIIKSRATPPEALGFLATDVRFKDSYKVKLALARNPRTPKRVSISLLKYLRVFDMADLSRNHFVPVELRQKAELSLMEKLQALPTGVKIALSRRASTRVVERIMERGDRRVIDACLDSPRLTEEQLYRLAGREKTKPLIILALAEHPAWSLRYLIRFALIRKFHTPMRYVERFIAAMKSQDLRNLYADPGLPSASRPFIFRELKKRKQDVELAEDTVYEVGEEEGLSGHESSSWAEEPQEGQPGA
jgi:hypothetical protein